MKTDEAVIKITSRPNANVKDVTALVRSMVDKLGYIKAKLQLQSVYGIEITIDWRGLK